MTGVHGHHGSRSATVAVAGVVGSVLWVGSGMLRFADDLGLSRPPDIPAWLGPALLLLALGSWLLPLAQLYRHGAFSAPRSSQFGFLLACAGLGLALAYAALQLLSRAGDAMLPLLGIGIALLDAGLVVIGSGLLQSVRPRSWQSLPLMIGLLGLFLPLGAGVRGAPGLAVWIVFGLGWAWLGLVLWLDADALARPRSVAAHRQRR